MSHSSIVRAVQIAVVIVSLAGGGVARAGVTLGASFGYTHLSYPDVPELMNDIIGVPGSETWKQPGLRVGYLAPSGRWDLNADVGLVHRSGTPFSDETSIELMPQVQANAPGRGGFSPFVNGGVGLVHERRSVSATRSTSATRPVFGAGIGVRKSVSDGHGLLRVELRYDHLPKHERELGPFTTFTFFATNMFSVKLGFDLLLAR